MSAIPWLLQRKKVKIIFFALFLHLISFLLFLFLLFLLFLLFKLESAEIILNRLREYDFSDNLFYEVEKEFLFKLIEGNFETVESNLVYLGFYDFELYLSEPKFDELLYTYIADTGIEHDHDNNGDINDFNDDFNGGQDNLMVFYGEGNANIENNSTYNKEQVDLEAHKENFENEVEQMFKFSENNSNQDISSTNNHKETFPTIYNHENHESEIKGWSNLPYDNDKVNSNNNSLTNQNNLKLSSYKADSNNTLDYSLYNIEENNYSSNLFESRYNEETPAKLDSIYNEQIKKEEQKDDLKQENSKNNISKSLFDPDLNIDNNNNIKYKERNNISSDITPNLKKNTNLSMKLPNSTSDLDFSDILSSAIKKSNINAELNEDDMFANKKNPLLKKNSKIIENDKNQLEKKESLKRLESSDDIINTKLLRKKRTLNKEDEEAKQNEIDLITNSNNDKSISLNKKHSSSNFSNRILNSNNNEDGLSKLTNKMKKIKLKIGFSEIFKFTREDIKTMNNILGIELVKDNEYDFDVLICNKLSKNIKILLALVKVKLHLSFYRSCLFYQATGS